MLVFCDTEKKPHEQYEDIKRKINEFHDVNNAADAVIIFGNPCTMQIISKHWTDESLKSSAKPVNVPLIREYTGVENYKDMSQRVKKLETIDTLAGSSNFGRLTELFEGGDVRWIHEINNRIEE